MPSHFSTIGFDFTNPEEYLSLAREVTDSVQAVTVPGGKYLYWSGSYGEELWLQVNSRKELVGITPHYHGKSLVVIRIENRVHHADDTPLEGAFYCWADPDENAPGKGAYPFLFDAVDAAIYVDLEIPSIARAQITAFAHEIEYYQSPEAFETSQKTQKPGLASKSFIPSGLFLPEGEPVKEPEATAIITGHVVEAGIKTNSKTGMPFYWALLDSFGASYDVVIDSRLLTGPPITGGVLSGEFWLSGRLISYQKRAHGFARLWKGLGHKNKGSIVRS